MLSLEELQRNHQLISQIYRHCRQRRLPFALREPYASPFENRGLLDQGSSAVSPEETKPEASTSYPLANRYSP